MKFNREQFVNDLRHLATMDCKWRHQGRTPETGMDCVFSPRWAFEQQGLRLPDELAKEFEHYHRPPDGQRMLSIMRRWFQEIPLEELQPADVIVAYMRKNPCHVMIKVSETEVAEAFESMDGHVSKFLIRPLDPRVRIAACFRIPDFA